MTYFEYQELTTGIVSVMISLQAIFITVFSAFVVMVYFVGRKLSKLEVIAISFVYSLFSGLMVFSMVNQLLRILAISNNYSESANIDFTVPQVTVALSGIAMIYGLSWAIGIIYMVKTHRSKLG